VGLKSVRARRPRRVVSEVCTDGQTSVCYEFLCSSFFFFGTGCTQLAEGSLQARTVQKAVGYEELSGRI
jgi:hypothetical protein